MRLLLLSAALLLSSCAMRSDMFDRRWTTTYYDRNNDGIIDFEYHAMRDGADTDWAYIDRSFRGYYDVRVHWGFARETKPVHNSIPRHVTITPGQPPVSLDKDLLPQRPNQAIQRTAR